METTTRHCTICAADVEMPVDLFAGLSAAPALVAEAIRAAPSAQREGWSLVELAAHLADAEIVAG